MTRRRYQTGCLFKRGRNWTLRYREDILNPDGTAGRVHRSVILGSFTTKKEALRAAESHLRPFNNGEQRPRPTLSLDDFWHQHFEPDILPTLKNNTRKHYKKLFTVHLRPALGQVTLTHISRAQVQRFITLKQGQGYATQTLAHLRNLLSKLFSTAISCGWLDDNPARGVQLPPMVRRRIPRVLTPEEITQLSHALEEPARTVVVLGVLTGLRIGELLGLQVEDVDFANPTLHIRRAMCRGDIGTPKTPGSERWVPLPDPLLNLLRHYFSNRRVKSPWLFPTTTGTFHNNQNLFVRQVQPAYKRLGIPHFSWHSLRHTFSTYQGNQGVPVPVLQSLLGHTTAKTTMLYTHPLIDAQKLALTQLASKLFPNVPKLIGKLAEDGRLLQ